MKSIVRRADIDSSDRIHGIGRSANTEDSSTDTHSTTTHSGSTSGRRCRAAAMKTNTESSPAMARLSRGLGSISSRDLAMRTCLRKLWSEYQTDIQRQHPRFTACWDRTPSVAQQPGQRLVLPSNQRLRCCISFMPCSSTTRTTPSSTPMRAPSDINMNKMKEIEQVTAYLLAAGHGLGQGSHRTRWFDRRVTLNPRFTSRTEPQLRVSSVSSDLVISVSSTPWSTFSKSLT